MNIRLNEDYYFWCCDWCDSENRVLWAKLQDGITCGACHRPMDLPEMDGVVINSTIAAGLCYMLRRTHNACVSFDSFAEIRPLR